MVRVGVVANFDGKRLAALAVTGFLHEFDGFVFTIELRQRRKLCFRRLTVGVHARRNHGVGGNLRTAVDFLGEKIAVDCHGQGLTDADIVIRRFTRVEGIVIGRKRRRNVNLFAIGLAQTVDLVRGKVVGEVHFLGFETANRSGLVVDRVEDDLVDLGVRCVPEVGVLDHRQAVIGNMRFKLVSTVRDHDARLYEVGSVLVKACLRDRQSCLVGKEFKEERC
ncbi:hypothetical protein D3C87_1371960 [compost metagenome]